MPKWAYSRRAAGAVGPPPSPFACASHDRIYRGSLAKSLRRDILFVPHVTIASTKSPDDGRKLVDDLNSRNIEVPGAIVSPAVVVEDGGRIKTIEEIALD